MTLAQSMAIALQVGILTLVFHFGLESKPSDMAYFFSRPRRLAKALIAMFVVVPLAAVGLVWGFDLHPAVKIILVAMAISPMAPFLPMAMYGAGGRVPYVIGLLTASSLVSLVFVPWILSLLSYEFDVEIQLPFLTILKVVGMSVLLPLAAGIAVNHWFPRVAAWLVKRIMLIVLLTVGGVSIVQLVTLWPVFLSLLGNGTLVAILALVVVAIAAGHVFGSDRVEEDRSSLVMACVSRHPAVALTIAAVNFPDVHEVMAVVLILIVQGVIVPKLYLFAMAKWHRGTA